MFIASLVVTFHSTRLTQLEQCLRFLCKHDRNVMLNSQLILVCQDRVNEVTAHGFGAVELLNLNLPVFNKSKMVNSGVRLAKADNLILLDGDRILSAGYFWQAINRLEKGRVLSARWLYKLLAPATDQQL